jgi:hypothetical protein
MTRNLPSNPSLRFLQEEAKDLLKAQRSGDARICATLRLLNRFEDADDSDILEAEVTLHEVQFALALDYGFVSWPKLKAHVEAVVSDIPAHQHAPKPGSDPDVRLVLVDVPKIGYYVRPCPFPGAVESLLGFIKEPVSYEYLMGVTGAAFRRVWDRDDGGNVDLMYFHPEPHRRLFEALGFGYRVVPRTDRDSMITAVKASIAAGMPVIAFGIIGPPEAGLVTGYDQGGDILLGHSYFDFTPRPSGGYYEQSDWHKQMDSGSIGMIVLGERRPRPEPRKVLITSLEWAIDLALRPQRREIPDHTCGLAAYEGWAMGLEVDADYPRNNGEVLRTRAMVYGDQAVMLGERVHAAAFLRDMVDIVSDASHTSQVVDELHAAADLYDEVGKTSGMWPWKAKDPHGEVVQQGLSDDAFRRSAAKRVRTAAKNETRAVEHLEKALAVLRSE